MSAGRSCWDNLDVQANDADVHAIDALEDSVAPLDEDTKRIRCLITSFEKTLRLQLDL